MSQLFDEKELLERVDGDVGFLADTVQMLESDGRSLMAQVKASIAAADAKAVGTGAHTLKGMISNFCAPTLQELALNDLILKRDGKPLEVTCTLSRRE